MKTNKENLLALKAKKEKAIKEYNKYLKEYNEEHKIAANSIIKDIIALHKKGLSNKEIIGKGFNKSTVNQQVGLYSKGKRVAKTVVAKYLPPKKLKK